MPVKRRIDKRLGGDTDLAVRLFEEMRSLPRCSCSAQARAAYRSECAGCVRFWELEVHLMHALDLRLWNFPMIWREPPDRRRSWPDDTPQGRWLMLEAASKARRKADREARAASEAAE
jgi:hypothetical protein